MTFSKPVLLVHVLMFARCQRVVTSENVQLQAGMEKLLESSNSFSLHLAVVLNRQI